MADLLIEQLCQLLAAKLQAVPTAGLTDLIVYVRDAIESNVTLKTALTEKAVQINQGNATGYQVRVEGEARAYIGQHLHISDPKLVEAALNTILTAYLSKPVGTANNLPPTGAVRFVGREAALAAVHEKLQGTTTLAISSVSGMGGVGKTELALQYAYGKLGEAAYSGGICWVEARSQDVGVGILEFARTQLGLPQPPEQLQTVAEQVAWVYRRWQGEPILIVLDDVIDFEAVKPYLPSEPRFRILMTTRLKLGTPAQRLELEVLTEAASLELLQVLVGDAARIDSQLEEAKQLCEWLGYLPLGLELVGRYLARKQDLSLTQLLERLQDKRLAAKALVQAKEMTAQLGVAAAFELTWAEPDFPDEARMLCGLLSVFALAPIPWNLVEQCLPDRDQEDLEDYRDDQLLGRSLLSRVGQERYQLHQLIREFFAVKLETELSDAAEPLQRNFAEVLTAVAKTIPYSVTLDVIARVEDALPHLEAVADRLTHLPEGEDKFLSLPGLARVAEAQSRWQEAEQWLKRSLQIREAQLGSEHPGTASSLNNLAELYRAMGRYSEAEPLYVRSLQIYEAQLGAEHPHTASSLNSLAELYRAMGRYSEAEPLYVRSLQIYEAQLGAEHPHTATSFNNLAGLYRAMGCYSEAEPLYVRSLQIQEAQLGAEHPDTATSLNNLAGLYEAMGRYSEAEPLYVRSLQIREAQLGAEHPHTATSLNNLAGLYRAMGRYSEAEPLYVRSLQIYEAQLGAEHPLTATSLNNLAGLYRAIGRYSEAEPLHVRSLQIQEAQLGAEHPLTATSFNNLAGLYEVMGRYSEAEPLHVRSLQIREAQLGAEHPDTATSFNNLAELYRAMGRYSEAEPLYLRTLKIFLNCLGENHPHTQTAWNNFCYLIQQAVQNDRAGELSAHPTTQAILQQML